MVTIVKTEPSIDSNLLEAKSISECLIVCYILVLCDKVIDLQWCEKMRAQVPIPNTLGNNWWVMIYGY